VEGCKISNNVSFEEFSRLDLRVGKVVSAERVAGTKKLVKLLIDIGGGNVKQSLAGLGDLYSTEELQGRQVIVITNLKPRKLFGLTSEVMLLAAVHGNDVSLLKPDKQMPEGSKVT
jgi:methionine--tRNA ligase beta chain